MFFSSCERRRPRAVVRHKPWRADIRACDSFDLAILMGSGSSFHALSGVPRRRILDFEDRGGLQVPNECREDRLGLVLDVIDMSEVCWFDGFAGCPRERGLLVFPQEPAMIPLCHFPV